MSQRYLTALPVFNEAESVDRVLNEVSRFSGHILVVDDGSTDATAAALTRHSNIDCVTHAVNRGYGAALQTAFEYAQKHSYETIVTIDCDGQHEPQRIPRFAAACQEVDIVSGSRYLKPFPGDTEPPAQRRWINSQITSELNELLRLGLTDAFCGFKAYRVAALSQLNLTEAGYAMPLELWVQAAHAGLRIIELPVPLIYLDEKRSFGSVLDDGATRLDYYHSVINRSLEATGRLMPAKAALSNCGDHAG